MALLAAILDPIVSILTSLLNLLAILVFVRALLSFFTVDRYHPLYRALVSVTEPVLVQARRLPHIFGGYDLSPAYAMVGLTLIARIIQNVADVVLHPRVVY